MTPLIRHHPPAAVVNAGSTLMPATAIAPGVRTLTRIQAGHKVAVRAIAPGEPVHKYGQIIGFALEPIQPGQHVHVHNLGMGDFAKDYAYTVDAKPTPRANVERTFQGI